MPQTVSNIDLREIERFDRQAAVWWDPKGPLKALHDINPLRLNYIRDRARISGQRILDVGCGGGLLSEALAQSGGRVTGIDLSAAALDAARAHLPSGKMHITYQHTRAEDLADAMPGAFDVVVCMELLEHVPDPRSVITACHTLLRPGGDLFVSTINRTFPAFVLAVIAAEYLLGIVEKGTHHYRNFIRPGRLSRWGDVLGLEKKNLSGFLYIPFVRKAFLTPLTGVNYMMHFKKTKPLPDSIKVS